MQMTNKTAPAPAALAAAERSEPERSEGERSAAAAKAGAPPAAPPRPNPEVVAKPRRRAFTADFRDCVKTPGSLALEAWEWR